MGSTPEVTASSTTVPPRWAADEMLGRLARYLRFVGHDTLYLKGLPDSEIILIVSRERRRLITRDRDLARKLPHALLLTSTDLEQQFRSVVRACPELPFEVQFVRCTLCNGRLRPDLPEGSGGESGIHRGPMWQCATCGHRYWDGSHTAAVRARVSGWLAQASP